MSSFLFGALATIASLAVVAVGSATGLLQSVLRYIYGDFTKAEVKKFVSYGVLFFFIIGVYWLLRCAKDPMFNELIVEGDFVVRGVIRFFALFGKNYPVPVGSQATWIAKIISLLVIFPLVGIYSYLIDLFPRHRMFYAVSAIYIALFVLLGYFAMSPVYGYNAPMANRIGLLGWLSYVVIESFGSLTVVLFYSFMADTTTPQAGKKAFYITATFGQLGAILGSKMTGVVADLFSVPQIFYVAALAVLLIPALVWFIMWYIPKAEMAGYQAKSGAEKKNKPGIIDGLKLFLSQPFLLGIFIWITAFEVIATVFDLRFKILIQEATLGNKAAYAQWTSDFGVWVGVLALVSLLLGVGNIGRRIGLTLSLVALPFLMAFNAFFMFAYPVVDIAFYVMVASKGINYAFGQPSKEQLFIPVSQEARYKSKAWIDSFGSRGAKAGGSLIQGFVGGTGLAMLFMVLGVSAIWAIVALFLGRKATYAVENNEIVC